MSSRLKILFVRAALHHQDETGSIFALTINIKERLQPSSGLVKRLPSYVRFHEQMSQQALIVKLNEHRALQILMKRFGCDQRWLHQLSDARGVGTAWSKIKLRAKRSLSSRAYDRAW